MKTLFVLFTLALVSLLNILQAQPTIEWQRCLGGTDVDLGKAIIESSNGDFVVAGGSESNSGVFSGNHGGTDAWISFINSSGELQSNKCFGGSGYDFANSICKMSDGNFVFVGSTGSNDGDVNGNHGGLDIWVVKFNPLGIIQWQRCLGGGLNDIGYKAVQTLDGGLILVGSSYSNDGDVSGNHGLSDIWVCKLSNTGNLQWQICYGGSEYEHAYTIQSDLNGGFLIAGFTDSNNGDVIGNHGDFDFWVLKINSNGNIIWQNSLGGSGADKSCELIPLSDGGAIVAGESMSNDNNVNGNHGNGDVWIVRLNYSGNILWQTCLGGSGNDKAASITPSNDNGYFVVGGTNSNDGSVSGVNGNYDAWVIKINSNGEQEWQKCIGGTGDEIGLSIILFNSGKLVAIAATNSNDGDVSGNSGNQDAWVVKLNESTATLVHIFTAQKFNISPNPTTGSINLKTDPAFISKPYQIFNPQGKAVLSGQISAEEMSISTEGLPAGIYTILADGRSARLVKE